MESLPAIHGRAVDFRGHCWQTLDMASPSKYVGTLTRAPVAGFPDSIDVLKIDLNVVKHGGIYLLRLKSLLRFNLFVISRKQRAIRSTHPKVIQSVMRHSTITLTMDTYGHLLEGSQAAAITHAADLTSIPNILRATGTDPKLANNVLTNQVRGGCLTMLEGANSPELNDDSIQQETRKIPRENAGLCGTMLDGAERRTRDSNPQPVSRRLISNQVPNHSAILQRKG